MTVDFDLLADYVGGVLDGTPEAAAVERLIADDPRWAEAYAGLGTAVEAVRLDLSTLTAEPMPAEVAARIEGVLTPVPQNVVALEPRRRWNRRFMPVAVAAGLLIVVGIGATVLRGGGPGQQESATSSAADSGAGSASEPQPSGGKAPLGPLAQLEGDSPRIRRSGTDYQRETVTSFPSVVAAKRDAEGAPAELDRLKLASALTACLEAIKKAHGAAVTSVPLVDLARFEGSAAVVALVTDGSGGQWVWVSGPDCGRSGADTRFTTRIA